MDRANLISSSRNTTLMVTKHYLLKAIEMNVEESSFTEDDEMIITEEEDDSMKDSAFESVIYHLIIFVE